MIYKKSQLDDLLKKEKLDSQSLNLLVKSLDVIENELVTMNQESIVTTLMEI
jgi:hypothetical protein